VFSAQILHEGMPRSENPSGATALDAVHRSQPGFQSPVVGLDRVCSRAAVSRDRLLRVTSHNHVRQLSRNAAVKARCAERRLCPLGQS
jgi:hypothetical protein